MSTYDPDSHKRIAALCDSIAKAINRRKADPAEALTALTLTLITSAQLLGVSNKGIVETVSRSVEMMEEE